tara:strand:- start:353 stop:1096 length:744 start_codon:yes stop_codon:yes gene_type:complete
MDRERTVESLRKLLADTYILYIATQNAHWNVIGNDFPQLHQLFQTQYEELQEAVDKLAEHIRTYKFASPGSAREFLELTSVEEIAPDTTDSSSLIQALLDGHNAVIATATELGEAADDIDAIDTENLAAERIEAHKKATWMLQSTLGGRTPELRRNPRHRRWPRGRQYHRSAGWRGYGRRRNPWTAANVKRHNKKCASKAACRRKWPSIANAVLRDSGDEGKAIRIANWQTKRMGLYSRNPFSRFYY